MVRTQTGSADTVDAVDAEKARHISNDLIKKGELAKGRQKIICPQEGPAD